MLKKAVLKKNLICFFNNVKDTKKTEILLKLIERVYTKNPRMQKLIDES